MCLSVSMAQSRHRESIVLPFLDLCVALSCWFQFFVHLPIFRHHPPPPISPHFPPFPPISPHFPPFSPIFPFFPFFRAPAASRPVRLRLARMPEGAEPPSKPAAPRPPQIRWDPRTTPLANPS